jgi:hypothetical protein
MLLRLSRVVIDAGFPTPAKKPLALDFDADEFLQPLLDQGRQLNWPESGAPSRLGLDIRGPGGGQWQLLIGDGQLLGAEQGLQPAGGAVARFDVDAFADLIRGRVSLSTALADGTAEILGNGQSHGEYAELLDQLCSLPVA